MNARTHNSELNRTAPASPGPPRGRLRTWLGRTLLVGFGLVIAVVLGEIGLRVAGYRPLELQPNWLQQLRTIQRPVADGGPLIYELVPDGRVTFVYRGPAVEYRINADGLRSDKRYARPKPAGQKRIVMLGDSVLFGLGVPVEQIFSTRLEKMLPGTEVINSGVGGYSTYNERVWFETQGLTYQPDTIVLCYCPNDVDEPLQQFSLQISQPLPAFPEDSIPNKKLHAEVARNFDAERARNVGSTRAGGLPMLVQEYSALVNLCFQPLSFGRRSRTHERCLLAAADEKSEEYAWLRREFTRIARTAGDRRIGAYFVYIPLRYELDVRDPRHAECGKHVSDLAKSCGFRVIDVAGALEPIDSHIDVSHLSPDGHRVVAELVANSLKTSTSD